MGYDVLVQLRCFQEAAANVFMTWPFVFTPLCTLAAVCPDNASWMALSCTASEVVSDIDQALQENI